MSKPITLDDVRSFFRCVRPDCGGCRGFFDAISAGRAPQLETLMRLFGPNAAPAPTETLTRALEEAFAAGSTLADSRSSKRSSPAEARDYSEHPNMRPHLETITRLRSSAKGLAEQRDEQQSAARAASKEAIVQRERYERLAAARAIVGAVSIRDAWERAIDEEKRR